MKKNRWLVVYTPYGIPALETALPVLVFVAVWMPELVVSPPDCTKSLWLAPKPIADSELEPDWPPTETALPALEFVLVWLHEVSVVPPD